MSDPGPELTTDFNNEVVKNLVGLYFDHEANNIEKTTLYKAMYEPQRPGMPAMYMERTMIFVGPAGNGKTELVSSLCRESCKRNGKDKYCAEAHLLDPYGCLTKSGRMGEFGAFGLGDFETKAKLEGKVSVDEKKRASLM